MTTQTTIDLTATDANRRSYGARWESAPYSLTGTRVRNPGHPHTVTVWETDDGTTVTLEAGAFIVDGRPHPRAGTLNHGDTVTLTADGVTLGDYVITPRPLADPILIPVTN